MESLEQSSDNTSTTYNTKSSSIKSEYDNNDFLNTFQAELYPHQIQALEELNNNDKGIIASFCGTGKSRIMTEFIMQQFDEIDEDNPQHILVVFPSLLLLNQFYEKYIKDQEINTILICSESKSKLTEEWFQQIQSLTLITYQSLNKIVKFRDYFTYALFDEAHHICTKNRVSIIKALSANCYYFTATPQQTKYLNMFESNEDSSNAAVKYAPVLENEQFNTGGIIFEYDFTDALEDQIVSDYQLLFRLYRDPDPTENKELKQLQAILHMAKEHQRKRIIVFNQYVQSSKFNKTNCKNFEINNENIRIVSGSTQKQKRQEIFSWFQQEDQEIKIICNVSCVKEGVDLPCTDMIVFCDEKQSKIQIVQALGRGTRKYKKIINGIKQEKSDCLVTALIDYQQNIEELTHFEDQVVKDRFKIVSYLCKALKNIDSRIQDIMNGKQSSLKLNIEAEEFKQLELDYVDSIRTKLFSLADSEVNWMSKYKDCVNFKEINDRYPSSKSRNQREKKLGSWLGCQKKTLKGRGTYKLTEERKQLLEQYLVDFISQDDLNNQLWIQKYKDCVKFKQQNNKYPSKESQYQEEKKLGHWLSNQKKAIKGNGISLIEERKQLLEQYLADFKTDDQIWNQKYQDCVKFKEENNRCPSQTSENEEEKILSQWLCRQKQAIKGKGYITEERKQLLEQYLADVKTDDEIWDQKYQDCVKFKQQNNKYPVQQSKNLEEKILGIWLCNQRRALKGTDKSGIKLTEERKQLLEEYLADFKTADEIWAQNYQNCVKFKQQNNKYPQAEADTLKEKQLGQWLANQKQALKGTSAHKQSEQRTQLLLQYLSDYKANDQIWNEKYQACVQFKQEKYQYPAHNSKNKKEVQLAQWLCSQKRILKEKCSGLSLKKRQLLEDYLADFQTDDQIWIQKYQDCVKFKEENQKYPSYGSQNQAEKKLGSWLSCQKMALKNKGSCKLTEERKQLLEEYLTDFQTDDQIWNQNYQDCVKFKEQNNKYPQNHSKNIEEKRLCTWLSNQKKAQRKLTEEKNQLLKDYLVDFQNFDDKWDNKYEACLKFKQETNKYPSSSSTDQEEKRLGQWICSWKQTLKGTDKSGKKLTEERKQLLEQYLNDYDPKLPENQGKYKKSIQKQPNFNLVIDQINTNTKDKRSQIKPQISQLHKEYKTLTSKNLNSKFKQNPQLWKQYHQISEQNEKGFADQENLPYKRIIRYLQNMKFKRTKLILDLGCGMNRIKQALQHDPRFQFLSFDHIAVDETVQECDISNLPLEEDSVNICILCLSLWGSNCLDYIKECYRVLEQNGILLIIEPTKRWLICEQNKQMLTLDENQQYKNRLADECQNVGFQVKLLDQDSITGQFIHKFMFLELTKK